MKRYNYIFLLFLFIVAFSACKEDFLDLKPEYAIDSETALEDSAKLESFITGIYDLKSYWYYEGHIIMSGDVRGGDVIVRNYSNYGRFVPDYQYNIITTYYMPDYVWLYAFKTITAANLVINSVPENDFSEAYINEVVAEARALRANAYLNLLNFFCHPYSVDPNGLGLPIVENSIGPNDEFPSRGTVQEVYDLMLSDLQFADQNLGDRNSTSIMRINSNAVDGFLARVYLNMGNWSMASSHAKDARVGFPLASASDLTAGFVDPTSEWIMAIDHRQDDNNGYLLVPSFYDPNDDGYSSFKASQDFVSLYEANDSRQAYFGTIEQPADAYKVNKFYFRSTWDLDQVLMRSAEMFLIEAESEAELGNTGAAITALNAVQSRANATLTDAGTTGQALIDVILIERRKELFGEGFASYDLQRRNLPLDRTGVGHWQPINLAANDDSFLYPIPQAEIDANPNMIQNDGY